MGACTEVYQVPEILGICHALAQRVRVVHLPDLDYPIDMELDALLGVPGGFLELPLEEHGGAHGRKARERCAAQYPGLEGGGAGAVAYVEERERAAALLAACDDPAADYHMLAHAGVPRVKDGADACAGDRGLQVIHGERGHRRRRGD